MIKKDMKTTSHLEKVVKKIKVNNGKHEKLVQKIRDLNDQGYNTIEIAKKVKRSISYIQVLKSQYKLVSPLLTERRIERMKSCLDKSIDDYIDKNDTNTAVLVKAIQILSERAYPIEKKEDSVQNYTIVIQKFGESDPKKPDSIIESTDITDVIETKKTENSEE